MAITTAPAYRPGFDRDRRTLAERREPAVTDMHAGAAVRELGIKALYLSLGLIFLWIGGMKFTAYEAQAISGLVMNSPLLAWMHGSFGIQGTSMVIGVYEIATGLLILARVFSPTLSAIGGAMGVVTFLVTLSFMFTTPGVTAQEAGGFPALSAEVGQFLAKDMALLAASLFILGDSLIARMARLPR